MDSPEKYFLTQPDEAHRPLGELPVSREAVIRIVQKHWAGPGRYTFVREVSDPQHGDLEITDIAVSTQTIDRLWITYLTPASASLATSNDILFYLQAVTGIGSHVPLQLSIDIYEDTPDCERNFAWLSLEDHSGASVAEFGLEVRDRLSLSERSESCSRAVHVCQLPTFRSAFRFVSIACEAFRCDKVRFRSFPLNSTSVSWFC
jgi:hypothetical protein